LKSRDRRKDKERGKIMDCVEVAGEMRRKMGFDME